MTDTSTDPYAITVDPDGVTYRRFCNLCPSQAVGNDETLIRETAENHLGEAHSTRTNSTTSEAAVNAWITDANDGLGSDVGDLMQALEQARADDDAEPHDDGVSVSQAAMEATLAAADEDRDRLEALVAERDAEIERLRRERTHGTTRRGCLALDCWTEFELFSPDDPATGWKQAHALGGYLCPVHAELLEAHLPRPAYTPQRMTCSCGWESVPVHHRGAGAELWLDHAHEVTEARDASRAPESSAGAATPRATPDA